MLLRRVAIENYRGIVDLVVELDRMTVLIGENNTGKTSILEALHTCMNRGLSRRATPFSEFDFHLADADAEPIDSPTLKLTLTFEEQEEDEWPEAVDQAFGKAVQFLDDNRKCLTFRVTALWDKVMRDFAVEWSFLDTNGNTLPTAKQVRMVADLQQLAPVFLLGAVREASHHFHSKSSFWGPFTKNLEISDQKRAEIEDELEEINQAVLDAHKPFNVVKDHMAQLRTLVTMADTDVVSLEAVPARIFDMLSRTQVKLATPTNARLPVGQHGSGTQSLSVLFLFRAFLQSRLAEAFDKDSMPILALEEPEAHLHPSAVRALWPVLDGLAGQKIIATHSGDLLAVVPLTAIRRLARKNGKVEVFQVKGTTLDGRDQRKVAYHIRAKRGALLFARCWLLVEGETEFTLLPELARVLGYDFELAGVCCVEYAQCDPSPLIKVATDLGIEWHLVADGDDKGRKYCACADELRANDPTEDRYSILPDLDIEHCFWNGGFESVYESAIDTKRRAAMINVCQGDDKYPTQAIKAAIRSACKPVLAYAIAEEVAKRGPSSIPPTIAEAIKKAVSLAGR